MLFPLQCDQIGLFMKSLGGQNFHTKVTQIVGNLFGYFVKCHNLTIKSAVATILFGQLLDKLGLLFISTSSHNVPVPINFSSNSVLVLCHVLSLAEDWI